MYIYPIHRKYDWSRLDPYILEIPAASLQSAGRIPWLYANQYDSAGARLQDYSPSKQSEGNRCHRTTRIKSRRNPYRSQSTSTFLRIPSSFLPQYPGINGARKSRGGLKRTIWRHAGLRRRLANAPPSSLATHEVRKARGPRSSSWISTPGASRKSSTQSFKGTASERRRRKGGAGRCRCGWISRTLRL